MDTPRIVPIHSHLFLALCKHEHVASIMESDPKMYFATQVMSSDGFETLHSATVGSFHPSDLSEICRFDSNVKSLMQLNPKLKLIVCATNEIPQQVHFAFLLGCHMIMTLGLGFEETYLAFRPLHNLFAIQSTEEMSLEKSLRAFCCAKCLNWIDFGQGPSSCCGKYRPICMEEYDKYARYTVLL
jgi:hypothetical protein